MGCDLCGKEGELFKVEVEGTTLNVCKDCSNFGKVISKVEPEPTPKERRKIQKQQAIVEEEPEVIYEIVSNYASLIRKNREKLKLKQEELAKKIAEKASVVNNLESGKFKPSLKLAGKLEKFLNIKLIEEVEVKDVAKSKKSSNEAMTLGDMIKLK